MVKNRKIIFKIFFEEQRRNIAKYIRTNSPENSKNQVLLKVDAIKPNPKLFPKEIKKLRTSL